MIDKTALIEVEDMKNMNKVKGHTRIELTNTKTGEKKVFEHDNIFQSAILAKQLRSLGSANNSPWAVPSWANNPLWKMLCGGIYLFEDTIDTTNGDVPFAPKTNKMIANGRVGYVNTGEPTELGDYNNIESSTSGGSSLSFVYDWGTSFGNGTISCICLGGYAGGYIGYGNTSGKSVRDHGGSLESPVVYQADSWVDGHAFSANYRYKFDDVDMTNNKLIIKKSNNVLARESIFNDQNWATVEKTFTGSVLSSSTGQMTVKEIYPNKYAIVKSNGGNILQNNTSANILVFDASNETVSTITISNTTGAALHLIETYSSGNAMYSFNLLMDENGNLFVCSNHKVYKFDSSGVYVTSIDSPQTDDWQVCGHFSNDVMFVGTLQEIYIFDGSSFKITNAISHDGSDGLYDYNSANDCLIGIDARRANARAKVYKNPFYLATVNNLQTPVVKDNTQTMKVIYTLTEA